MPGNNKKRRSGRKKPPKNYIGKRQLQDLLENTTWSIDVIAKKLKTTPTMIRKYIEKHGL